MALRASSMILMRRLRDAGRRHEYIRRQDFAIKTLYIRFFRDYAIYIFSRYEGDFFDDDFLIIYAYARHFKAMMPTFRWWCQRHTREPASLLMLR